jgi:hypothetical protein
MEAKSISKILKIYRQCANSFNSNPSNCYACPERIPCWSKNELKRAIDVSIDVLDKIDDLYKNLEAAEAKLSQIDAATLSCASDESIIAKIQAILRGEQG